MTEVVDTVEETTVEQPPENDFLDGREGDAKALEQSLSETDEEMEFTPPSQSADSPETAQDAVSSEEGMSSDEAGGVAFMAIASYEGLIRTFVGEEFELPDSMRQEAIAKYTPLLEKHGPRAIGTFGRYKDEIMAGVFTLSLVRESFAQIKAINAQKALNDLNDEQPETPETAPDAVQEDAA